MKELERKIEALAESFEDFKENHFHTLKELVITNTVDLKWLKRFFWLSMAGIASLMWDSFI